MILRMPVRFFVRWLAFVVQAAFAEQQKVFQAIASTTLIGALLPPNVLQMFLDFSTNLTELARPLFLAPTQQNLRVFLHK